MTNPYNKQTVPAARIERSHQGNDDWRKTMYEMYPEWGPAAHDEDHPANPANWATPVQESMDLRDNGGERPDDN